MCRREPPYHTEVYRGFTINIRRDEDGWRKNPYEDQDGMYPMMVDGGSRSDSHDYYDASKEFLVVQDWSWQWETERGVQVQKQLAELLGAEGEEDEDVQQDICELIAEAIKGNKLEKLESVGKILRIPCLHTSSNGYCQGDHIEMLVVWTPEFEKRCGVKRKEATDKSMEMNAKIFAAWCWGDVYGFEIEGIEGIDDIEDSCWGFIEPESWPAEKMYVLQEAHSAVDWHIKRVREQHVEQLKTWVRNRVPFMHRKPAPAAVFA